MDPKRPTPAQLRALKRADPRLGEAMGRVPRFPGFPQPGQHRSHWEALARAIVYQQLAEAAARTIFTRCCALTPGPGFPRAEVLAGIPDASLRGAGLSANKLASLRDLSEHVLSGALPLQRLSRLSDVAVEERLVAVRGIGPWTAQMFLMFRLGRLDVMAPGDLGLQEGLRRLDGLAERPGPKQLAARAEAWAPLRSVAAWVLWRLADE